MSWFNHTRINIEHFIYLPNERSLATQHHQRKIILSEQCSQVLNILCIHAKSDVSRDELIEHIWGDKFETGNKGLNQVIWQLRKAFEQLDSNIESVIKRVPKKGYSLEAYVRFSWVYTEKSADTEALTFSGSELWLKHTPIPLSPLQQRLLTVLVRHTPPINHLDLCAELNLECAQLMNLLGEFQLTLVKQHPHAAVITGWDGRAIAYQAPLTKTSVANDTKNNVKATPASVTVPPDSTQYMSIKRRTFFALLTTSVLSWILLASVYFAAQHVGSPLIISDFHDHALLSAFTHKQLADLERIQEKKGEITIRNVLEVTSQSLAAIKNNTELSKEEYARVLGYLGQLNFRFDQLASAEEQLRETIRVTETLSSNDWKVRKIELEARGKLIELLSTSGEYIKAQKMLNKTLQRLSLDYPEYALLSVKLSIRQLEIHINHGKFKQAKLLAEKLVTRLENSQLIKQDLSLLTDTLNLYSIVLRQLNDVDAAIVTLQKLLALEIELHGDQHEATISRYMSLAVIYTFNGQTQKALHYFETAIALNTQLYGEHSVALPLMLNNQSYALFELGRIEDAIEASQRAIEMDERYFGKHAPRSAFLYLTKATHLFHHGDIDAARTTNAIALQLFQKPMNAKHPLQGRALELQAHIHRVDNDIILCESHMNLAEEIYKEIFKDEMHWVRQVSKLSMRACELTSRSTQATSLITNPALTPMLNTLIASVGANALPVKHIQYKLAQYKQPK